MNTLPSTSFLSLTSPPLSHTHSLARFSTWDAVCGGNQALSLNCRAASLSYRTGIPSLPLLIEGYLGGIFLKKKKKHGFTCNKY